jgi:hypothetical protein
MKTKKSRVFLGTIVLTMALGLSLLAAPPVRANEITVANLLGGLDVVIGDKSFENWRDYVSIGTNGALAVNPSEISVSFSINGSGEFVIDYQTGAMSVGQNQIQDTRFTYDVRVVTGEPKLEDNGMDLLSFGLGHNQEANLGRISISETVTDAAGNLLGTKLVYDDHGVVVISDHISWDPPVAFLTVRNDIALSGDNTGGGGASISDFSQTFSQTAPIPEPTTMLLLGSGLLGLVGYGRKKFFKK